MRKGISTCGIGSVTSKVPVHPAVTLKHMPQQKGTKLRGFACSCRIGRRGRRERSIKSVLLIATINRTFQPLVQPPGCATGIWMPQEKQPVFAERLHATYFCVRHEAVQPGVFMQRRLRHKPGLRHAPFIQRGKALYRDRAASVFNPERRVCAGSAQASAPAASAPCALWENTVRRLAAWRYYANSAKLREQRRVAGRL